MKRTIAALLSCGTCFLAACSTDKGQPPRAVKDDSAIGLIPISMSGRHLDAGLVGPAASAEEPARPAAAAPSVAVDTSTPEAAARSYVDLINAGQLVPLAQILMPDQQPAAAQIAQVLAPVAEAAAQLRTTLSGKFADHAFVLSLQNEAIPADWLKHWTVVNVEADATNPDTATANLKVVNGEETATRTLKKMDDKWHVQEAQLPAVEAVTGQAAVVAPLAEALRGLAGRVEAGQVADAVAAEQEIMTAITGAAAAATADTGGQATPSQTAPPPAPANNTTATPAPERSKSELEQQMDDAAGRAMYGAP